MYLRQIVAFLGDKVSLWQFENLTKTVEDCQEFFKNSLEQNNNCRADLCGRADLYCKSWTWLSIIVFDRKVIYKKSFSASYEYTSRRRLSNSFLKIFSWFLNSIFELLLIYLKKTLTSPHFRFCMKSQGKS